MPTLTSQAATLRPLPARNNSESPSAVRAGESSFRIALLVPDGVGVRNFVLGPFLREASRLVEVDVLHTIPAALLGTYEKHVGADVRSWHVVPEHVERPVTFLLRNCLSYAQMYWVDTFPMRKNRSLPQTGSWRSRSARRLARFAGRLAATPGRMLTLDRIHAWVNNRYPEVEHFREQFRRLRPSLLLCSHQRPLHIIPPVLAAKSLGIPTATFIFSWDNITTKGRICAPFDHFLVWSQHMRDELLRVYPHIPADHVHIVGTPQFDPYGDAELLRSREEFLTQLGGDPNRKLICFSGGDAKNAPDDPNHLEVLLQQIREGRIAGNPQVVLRPAPIDDGSRFAGLRERYPELLYSQPCWVHEPPYRWSTLMPLPEDIALLANLTHHSDLNINFASTMTLDFACRGKPVVNLAFDVSDPPPHGVPLWDYVRQFEHYQPVIELQAARFARSPQQLADHVNAFLGNPQLDTECRQRFVDLQVGAPLGMSSRCICDLLSRLAESPK